jgi:hypothetical protein
VCGSKIRTPHCGSSKAAAAGVVRQMTASKRGPYQNPHHYTHQPGLFTVSLVARENIKLECKKQKTEDQKRWKSCTAHRDKQQLEKTYTTELHTTCAKRKLRMKEAY